MNQEFYRMQMLAGIITEGEYNFFSISESQTPELDSLIQKVKAAGTDISNKEVQMDILSSLIKTDFHPEKINPKDIKELKITIPESEGGGVFAHAIHWLEDLEVMEKLAHALGIPLKHIKWAKKALQIISEKLSIPFKWIQTVFYKLARFLGFDLEKSRIAGIGGLALIAIIGLAYAAASFPSILATLSGGFGLLAVGKLFTWLLKSYNGIKGIIQHWRQRSTEKENVTYSPTDFFKELLPFWKKIRSTRGEDIPLDWILSVEEFEKLLKKHKNKDVYPQFNKQLKNISSQIKSNKSSLGHFNNIINLVNQSEHYHNSPTKNLQNKLVDIFTSLRANFNQNNPNK